MVVQILAQMAVAAAGVAVERKNGLMLRQYHLFRSLLVQLVPPARVPPAGVPAVLRVLARIVLQPVVVVEVEARLELVALAESVLAEI